MTASRGSRGAAGQTRRRACETRLQIKVVPPSDEVAAVEAMRRFVEGMAELAAERILSGEFVTQDGAASQSSKIVPLTASRTP
jgi:hypothetical protein